MEVIRYFSLCEGLLTKNTIMELSNKEIFYRMKKEGFIQETSKNSKIFKATNKLKSLTSKMTDMSYSVGCSSKHSQKLAKAVSFLPKEIIQEGRYASGKVLHKEIQEFKQTSEYQNAISQLQIRNQTQYNTIQSIYQDKLTNSVSQAERLQAEIDYKSDIETNQIHRKILYSENPVFIPDFKTTISIQEAEEIINTFSTRADELNHCKEQLLLEQNILKLQSIIQNTSQSMIDIYWECITNSYGKEEIYKHELYSEIMNRDILYIY